MVISILVDNYKRSYLLPFIIQAYNKDYPVETPLKCEMICVDDNSNDNFVEFLELAVKNIKPKFDIRGYQTHKPTTYNPAKALNIAFKQSLGEIIILNHSDILPNSKHILQNILKEFTIEGSLLDNVLPNNGLPDIIVPHFIFEMNTLITYTGMLNNGTVMKRKNYEELHGHDERFLGGPSVDFDLMNRAKDMKFKIRWLKEDKKISYLHIGHIADAGIRFRDTPPEWRAQLNYSKEEHSYKRLLEYNNGLASIGGHRHWINSNQEWGTLDTLEQVFEYNV